MRGLYRAVWIASLLAILGMSVVFALQPSSPPVVAPMTAYVSEDRSLSLQYPGNWKPLSSSSHAVTAQVAFDPNATTHFAVETSLAGSLIGDVAKADGAMLSALPGMPAGVADKQKSPLEMLHGIALHAMAKNKRRYPDFTQGATQPMQIGGIESLATEFTFKEGAFWSKKEIAGTYFTLLAKDREVRVTAFCAQDRKKTMQPVFDQMIASLRFGEGGG